MTLLYMKDQKRPVLAHQKWRTIQWDPKLACHPIAVILYSEPISRHSIGLRLTLRGVPKISNLNTENYNNPLDMGVS